jgi:hypothetical protein
VAKVARTNSYWAIERKDGGIELFNNFNAAKEFQEAFEKEKTMVLKEFTIHE